MVAHSTDRSIPKLLLRTARTAALATIDRTCGAPLTTLVSIGADFSGAPLMLLSHLAHHTKNLAIDPRGSLLLSTRPDRGDPLNGPRLTLSGRIIAHEEASARARFIRQNPKSRLYAAFSDFCIYRMDLEAVFFNGGFARAVSMAPEDVLTNIDGVDSLIQAEEALLDWVNSDQGAIASHPLIGSTSQKTRRWRARSLDTEGLDIASGSATARIVFDAPVSSPPAWTRAFLSSSQMQKL